MSGYIEKAKLKGHIVLIDCALLVLPKKSNIHARFKRSKAKKIKLLYKNNNFNEFNNKENVWYQSFKSNTKYNEIKTLSKFKISILMPVYKIDLKYISEAINSVKAQTYPYWELICVDDGSQQKYLTNFLKKAANSDKRIQFISLKHNKGVSKATNIALNKATGDYILLMDHDDYIEPHALMRLSDAALSEGSDLIYGDEVITTENINAIIAIQARPIFSYDYYISHPYLVHPIFVKTNLAKKIGGLNTELKISQDIDFVLRILEIGDKITHIPDILYKWRTLPQSAGLLRQSEVMCQTCILKTEHLNRLGFNEATVKDGTSFNTYNVNYFGKSSARILAIIPTKNQVDFLRVCIDTLVKTTAGVNLDILIIDHESNDLNTLVYFKEIQKSGLARILPYKGKFNFSAMNNYAVKTCGNGYDHFLFLNNDIEAINLNWLEPMVDLANRQDVGAVGATLLYPDGRVQHSGVLIGTYGCAEHAFKFSPFDKVTSGYGGSLHATREYSAVTAACMLVPAEVFKSVNGYDETLEVGFGDTDLCLRIGLKGYRILNCAQSILIHHESVTRGKTLDNKDPHPSDSSLFKNRYQDIIKTGDPYFSPLLDKNDPRFNLDILARLETIINYRTVSNFRPKLARDMIISPLAAGEKTG